MMAPSALQSNLDYLVDFDYPNFSDHFEKLLYLRYW